MQMDDPAELCDSTGQVVAYAITPEWHRRFFHAWANLMLPEEPEEPIGQFREQGGLSIEELRADLASLKTSAPSA